MIAGILEEKQSQAKIEWWCSVTERRVCHQFEPSARRMRMAARMTAD